MLVLAGCSPSGGDSPSPSSAGSSPSPTAEPLPAGVTRIDLSGLAQPTVVVVGEGAAWARLADGSVARIDLATNALVATIAVGSGEYGWLAVGEGGVWVTTFDEDKVSRIDPATNQVVAEITVGTNPEGIAITPGAVWVSNHRAGSISRIDPATNTVVATLTFGPEGRSGPKNIELAAGALWTTVPNFSAVVRIDPASSEVTVIPVDLPEDLLSDGERILVYARGRLREVDPTTNTLLPEPIVTDTPPWAYGLGAWWTIEGTDLVQLDPATFAPVASWPVTYEPAEFGGLFFGDGSAWLTPEFGETLLRIDPEP